MQNFVIRLFVTAAALSAAAYLVPGIELTGGIGDALVVAFVFGAVNAILKPFASFPSCCPGFASSDAALTAFARRRG